MGEWREVMEGEGGNGERREGMEGEGGNGGRGRE